MSAQKIANRLTAVLAIGSLVVCLGACCHMRSGSPPAAKPAPAATATTVAPARTTVAGAPIATTPAVAQTNLLDQLQGKWSGHGAESDADNWEWTIAGDKIEARTSGGDTYKGTLKINDRTSPAQVDVKLTDCSDSSLNDETVQGIIKVEGRKMTFCLSEPGRGPRPTAFDSSESMVLVATKK
jgi:uncharacterized protein (TIGR03067 family)